MRSFEEKLEVFKNLRIEGGWGERKWALLAEILTDQHNDIQHLKMQNKQLRWMLVKNAKQIGRRRRKYGY
jgi:hypothetical protein